MTDPGVGRHQSPDAPLERFVVVPRTAGPLTDPDAGRRPGDDLDEIVDEMFGETTDEGPGPLDLILFLGGLALVVWAVATRASGLAFWTGVVALLLGLALPARSIVRAIGRRGVQRQRRRIIGHGYPIDVSHPATAALVHAYDELLKITTVSGSRLADDAIIAAHLALVEAASLLAGSAPVADAEVDYVEKRTLAIRDITAQLVRARRASRLSTTETDAVTEDRRRRATAVTEARVELESATHLGSLDQLQTLTTQIEHEAGDGLA